MNNTNGILTQIGNTPLIEINTIFNKPNVKLLLKLEGNNPGGSVKDRAAFNMINEALKRGDIKRGGHLVEATSGNTGIALSFIAQLLGMKISLVMPENATIERVKTMKAYGANVILTDQKNGIEGARDHAFKLRDEKGYYILNQFENDDNWKAHYKTTGPEIWRDTNQEVTHFVSAMGTTGTIMGVSSYLKSKNNKIQIIGNEPTEGSKIPGIRKWSIDYIPRFYDKNKVDRIVQVSQEDATEMSRKLAKEEGVFAGMSSGGSVLTAIKIANELNSGTVVAIICDRGDRYLSSSLFE